MILLASARVLIAGAATIVTAALRTVPVLHEHFAVLAHCAGRCHAG